MRLEEIKKKYRQLSLCKSHLHWLSRCALTAAPVIHPDKAPHPRAPEAFDLLKKAESELSDQNKREDLNANIHQARVVLLKSLGLPPATKETDPRIADLKDPSFKARLRAGSRELLIEEEVRRRKCVASGYSISSS